MVGSGIASALDNQLNGNWKSHPGAAGCSLAFNIVAGGIAGGLMGVLDSGLEKVGAKSAAASGWFAAGLGFEVGAIGGASDRATAAISHAVDALASTGLKYDDGD
jgi:hypothetical protein